MPAIVLDAVEERLVQATVAVAQGAGLRLVGTGIQNAQIGGVIDPTSSQFSCPCIQVSIDKLGININPWVFGYIDRAKRPVRVTIFDSGPMNDPRRRPLWLLWQQTLARAYRQPGFLATIQQTVPEVWFYGIRSQNIIDASKDTYQRVALGVIIDYDCHEQGT